LKARVNRHPNILEYFYTGIGMRLQNIDSEMCRSVPFLSFTEKKHRCPAYFHDSFRVAESTEGVLAEGIANGLGSVPSPKMDSLLNHVLSPITARKRPYFTSK